MQASERELYNAQDIVLEKVFDNAVKIGLPDIILCGGTALARGYLNHRVSYDLDFFVPDKFSPEIVVAQIGKTGIDLSGIVIEDRRPYVLQLHATTTIGEIDVKISIIEDGFAGMWDSVWVGNVKTEPIEGLYHRKLRTISGISKSDGRQTARDLYDLFVLDKEIERISDFVGRINKKGANFPAEMFCQKMSAIPWIDLMDEFDGLERSQKYRQTSMVGDIKKAMETEVNDMTSPQRKRHGLD